MHAMLPLIFPSVIALVPSHVAQLVMESARLKTIAHVQIGMRIVGENTLNLPCSFQGQAETGADEIGHQ